jgi:hypothetical protein
VAAGIPAVPVLAAFGALDALARTAGASPVVAGLACCGMALLGGLPYGGLFQRAANDPRGGWLYGLAFGFVLWMLGPVPLLQWLPDDGPALVGRPAIGLLLGQLLRGLALGVVFPLVHRRLHSGLEDRERANRGRFGREAVTRPLLARLGTR